MQEQREDEEQARIERLDAAIREAIDSIDRGEGIEFETMDKLEAYIHQIGEEDEATMLTSRP